MPARARPGRPDRKRTPTKVYELLPFPNIISALPCLAPVHPLAKKTVKTKKPESRCCLLRTPDNPDFLCFPRFGCYKKRNVDSGGPCFFAPWQRFFPTDNGPGAREKPAVPMKDVVLFPETAGPTAPAGRAGLILRLPPQLVPSFPVPRPVPPVRFGRALSRCKRNQTTPAPWEPPDAPEKKKKGSGRIGFSLFPEKEPVKTLPPRSPLGSGQIRPTGMVFPGYGPCREALGGLVATSPDPASP